MKLFKKKSKNKENKEISELTLLPPSICHNCYVETQQKRQRNEIGVGFKKGLRLLENPIKNEQMTVF